MNTLIDMLMRIKNAQMVSKDRVLVPASALKLKVANILKEAGYVGDISKKKRKAKKAEHDWLDIELKYDNKEGAISGIKFISRPSRHLYIGAKDIKPVRSGFGVAVISTSKGVMTGKEARKAGLGGEILFEVW